MSDNVKRCLADLAIRQNKLSKQYYRLGYVTALNDIVDYLTQQLDTKEKEEISITEAAVRIKNMDDSLQLTRYLTKLAEEINKQ